MVKSEQPATDLLKTLLPLKEKERIAIFRQLLPEGVDYAKLALEVLWGKSASEEIKIKGDAVEFLYKSWDYVSITGKGIYFHLEHWPKELIASFAHKITLLWLQHLLDEHQSQKEAKPSK